MIRYPTRESLVGTWSRVLHRLCDIGLNPYVLEPLYWIVFWIYIKVFEKNNDATSATDSLLQPTYVTQHLDSSVFIKYFSFGWRARYLTTQKWYLCGCGSDWQMSKCQKFRQLFHFSNPTLLNCAISICSYRFKVSLYKSLMFLPLGKSELGQLFIICQSGLNVLLKVARFVC